MRTSDHHIHLNFLILGNLPVFSCPMRLTYVPTQPNTPMSSYNPHASYVSPPKHPMYSTEPRDSIQVEWQYMDRLFRLVDTAGLTRVRPNKELLAAGEEKKRMRMMQTSGRYAMQLPGMEVSELVSQAVLSFVWIVVGRCR